MKQLGCTRTTKATQGADMLPSASSYICSELCIDNNALLLNMPLKLTSCKRKDKPLRWFEKQMKYLLSLQMFQLLFQETLHKAVICGCLWSWLWYSQLSYSQCTFQMPLPESMTLVRLLCVENIGATAGKGTQWWAQYSEHQLLKLWVFSKLCKWVLFFVALLCL